LKGREDFTLLVLVKEELCLPVEFWLPRLPTTVSLFYSLLFSCFLLKTEKKAFHQNCSNGFIQRDLSSPNKKKIDGNP